MGDKKKVGSVTIDKTHKGSELSKGPVRNIEKTTYYSDGSSHSTESVVSSSGSKRMSWDTDSKGNTSNRHVKKN